MDFEDDEGFRRFMRGSYCARVDRGQNASKDTNAKSSHCSAWGPSETQASFVGIRIVQILLLGLLNSHIMLATTHCQKLPAQSKQKTRSARSC